MHARGATEGSASTRWAENKLPLTHVMCSSFNKRLPDRNCGCTWWAAVPVLTRRQRWPGSRASASLANSPATRSKVASLAASTYKAEKLRSYISSGYVVLLFKRSMMYICYHHQLMTLSMGQTQMLVTIQ